MRGLSLFILAGAAATVGAVAVVVAVMSARPGNDASPKGEADGKPAAADGEAITSAPADGDAGYWTPERLNAAKPMPTPKVSKEEFGKPTAPKDAP